MAPDNANVPDTPNLRAYDDAMDAAAFMRAQAHAMLENAADIERAAKKRAIEYVGEQNTYDGPLLPLRHRLLCKELGYDIGFDGPAPSIIRSSK